MSVCSRLMVPKHIRHRIVRTVTSSPQHAEKESVVNPTTFKEYKDIPTPDDGTNILVGLYRTSKRIREAHKIWDEGFQKLGPIYRVNVLGPTIVLNDPEAIENILRHEGTFPKRIPLQIWNDARTEQGIPLGILLRYKIPFINLRVGYVLEKKIYLVHDMVIRAVACWGTGVGYLQF